MGLHLIAIGGTGAKIAESVVHTAATGLLRDVDRLSILFVDPDKGNGSLSRATRTVSLYNSARQNLGTFNDFFRTHIDTWKREIWSPLDDESAIRLVDLLQIGDVRAQQEGVGKLFDVLYTADQQIADLDVGFRGNPSIGAAVLARALNYDAEPWRSLREALEKEAGQGESLNILLLGSIFGGTGAAGIPTLGRLLRESVRSLGAPSFKIGCVLALPYFSFSFDGRSAKEVKAESAYFVRNTKAALHYYFENNYFSIFDRIYCLGDKPAAQMPTASLGGNDQANPAHYVEWLASLAIPDFLHGRDERILRLMGREKEEHLDWGDLPIEPERRPEARLVGLSQVASAYLGLCHPVLTGQSGARWQPWHRDLFLGSDVESERTSAEAQAVEGYFISLLRWMRQMEHHAGDVQLDAITGCHLPIVEDGGGDSIRISLERLGHSVVTDSDTHRIWNALNRAAHTVSRNGGRGFSGLVQALAMACRVQLS
jgi:hypothetical protein